MSATAVIRSAGAAACRRTTLRPTAARFRRILDANKKEPAARETIITPRRHYSSSGGSVVNTTKEEAAAGRISMKLDEASNAFVTHHLLLEHLVQEKIKYDRLKRVLLRVSIFAGIAFCVKKYFFSGSGDDEEAKKI